MKYPPARIASLALSLFCGLTAYQNAVAGPADEQDAVHCKALLAGRADPDVFGAEQGARQSTIAAALAFETDSYSFNSGLKQRPRTDIELIVLSSDDSDGFLCEWVGKAGYSVARAATFGGGTSVSYARRESDVRFALMSGDDKGPVHLELYHAPDPAGLSVERVYLHDGKEIVVPGLSIRRGSKESLLVCDHRGGMLRKLGTNGLLIEFGYLCEDQRSDRVDRTGSSQTFVYDKFGNVAEERWSDDLQRPGLTRYVNTLNSRGDWIRREFLMKTADDDELRKIREEYRFIQYRQDAWHKDGAQ